MNVFSLVATINSYGYNARVQQRPFPPHFLPPTVFFSRVIYVFRNESLNEAEVENLGNILGDEILFRSILDNSSREDFDFENYLFDIFV